jgi:adenine-specific DNA-methyltransferase
MFYPIYVKDGAITRIGEQPDEAFHPSARNVLLNEDEIEVWPIDQDGIERRWNFARNEITSHLDRIVSLPKDGGLDLFITAELSPPKTVWAFPELDAGGVYGSELLDKLVESKFPFPKSLYTVYRCIEPAVLRNPNALIIDFFAGSGTALNAVNVLNASDNGHRRCILVTNNEVSDAEARGLRAAGLQPGDPDWEAHGICRSITWPRTENSIMGRSYDGSLLTGDYITSQTTVREVARTFRQLGFIENPDTLTPLEKKQIVALIGKNNLPQSLVKADSRFIVSEKHTASILFDPGVAEDWLAALEEQEHITDFYIVAKDSRTFSDLKAKVVELLGTVSVTEPLKRPMSVGFAANVEYFKLGFLDKNSVSLGQQFAEILPLLWLKAGAGGERPEPDGEALPAMLILPQNSFAVLLDEDRYGDFAEKLNETDGIKTVYFVTNSEEAFREMSDGIGIERTYQLYRDYIDNFVIGSRRNNL